MPLSHLEEILTATSEGLYPRLALLQALPQLSNGHVRRTPSSDNITEARREFLDSFAYLCDIQKGGATTTAAGLQRLPKSNILWLSANEGIRSDIQSYADTILSKLRLVSSSTQKAIEHEIFCLAVEKCNSRIGTYKGEVRIYARNCRMQLRRESPNETGTMYYRVNSYRRKVANSSSGAPSEET